MFTEKDLHTLHDKADRLAAEKRFDEAIELYEKLIGEHPSNESLLLSLAWAYRDGGKDEKAIVCFESLFEREIGRKVFTGFAFDELVRLFREKGLHERLVSLCERVADAQPEDPALLCTLGEAYLKAEKADPAVRVFRKLTEMEPGSSAYFCLLGNAYALAGSPEKAEEIFEKAAAIDPGESHVFFNRLGNILAQKGDLERAVRILRKAIGEKPDCPFYYCTLGDVLIRRGRIDEARKAYDRAVELDEGSGEGYLNRLGLSLLSGGYGKEAFSVFESLVSFDPANPFYRRNLGEALKLVKPQ